MNGVITLDIVKGTIIILDQSDVAKMIHNIVFRILEKCGPTRNKKKILKQLIILNRSIKH